MNPQKYKKLTYLKQFFIKNQLFFEQRPKSKKSERRIVNSTMENSKKITASRSDITPFVNKSSKVYPKIGICKIEKIDFFDR